MMLEEWKSLPNYWKDKLTTEEGTKIHVITPLLESLNWGVGIVPTEDHLVEPEYKVQDGSTNKKVDYAFIMEGTPQVYVEAKSIRSKLKNKHKRQLFSYMRNDGVRFGVLTNGREVKLYINDVMEQKPDQYLVGEFSESNEYLDFINLIEKDNLLNDVSFKLSEEIIRLKKRDDASYTNLKENLKNYRITYTPEIMIGSIFEDYSSSEKSSNAVIKTATSKIEASPETRCGFYTGTQESIEQLFIDKSVWGAVKEPKKKIEYIAMYSKEKSSITHIGEVNDCIPVSEYADPEELPGYSEDKVVFKLSKIYELTDPIIHSSDGSFGFQFKYTTIKELEHADIIKDI